MSDEITVAGEKYISSKRAAHESTYTQDYIGQLARAGAIKANRVGGLWYVSLDSLTDYRSQAEAYKPQLPQNVHVSSEMDALVSFDGRQYVSAARAAKNTGYHQDYIGQLARSGKVLSRQIGNRWYVDNEALIAHKDEKDSLLGAVQSQSVGILRSALAPSFKEDENEPFFTYTSEEPKCLVVLTVSDTDDNISKEDYVAQYEHELHRIPIRINTSIPTEVQMRTKAMYQKAVRTSGKSNIYRFFVGVTLSMVIVLSIGFISLKSASVYSIDITNVGKQISELASVEIVARSVGNIAEWIEKLLAREITYTRTN